MTSVPVARHRGLSVRLHRYAELLLKHGFLIAITLFSLAPVLWLMGIAFRPVTETYVTPMKLLPRSLTLENTALVIRKLPEMAILYRNSFVITGVTVVSVVLIASWAGFAFARLRFPGRELFFWAVITSMFMPLSMAIPGLYQILSTLDVLDTLPGLFLPYTAWFLPLATFIMRNAFASVPRDLEDAAIVDGCSTGRLFWQVMMPLTITSAVTVAIFTFVPVWGEFLLAFTFTSSLHAMPMSVGIKFLQAGPATGEWTFPVAATAVLISFIPPLFIYVALQRWFSKGLLEGALKF